MTVQFSIDAPSWRKLVKKYLADNRDKIKTYEKWLERRGGNPVQNNRLVIETAGTDSVKIALWSGGNRPYSDPIELPAVIVAAGRVSIPQKLIRRMLEVFDCRLVFTLDKEKFPEKETQLYIYSQGQPNQANYWLDMPADAPSLADLEQEEEEAGQVKQEEAEAVVAVSTSSQGWSLVGKGADGPVMIAQWNTVDEPEADQPEEVTYDYSDSQEPEEEEETVIDYGQEEEEPEPEDDQQPTDFSSLVLCSDQPVYSIGLYGTKLVKNKPVKWYTVSAPADSGDYIAPAAIAEKPAPTATKPELGELLYGASDFEIYKNEQAKRYRLIFKKRLSYAERSFLFKTGWAWRKEFGCYQWGLTKNGEQAVLATVAQFK